MGANDRGIATKQLMSWYQRLAEREGQQVVTVGLGIASTIFRCWRWSITLFLSGNLTAPTTRMCSSPISFALMESVRSDGTEVSPPSCLASEARPGSTLGQL